MGLLKANLEGVFAVEKNADAFKTLKHNLIDGPEQRFSWPEWLPKEPLTTSELLNNYSSELAGLRNKIDLVAGGPPCQGFSFAGRRNPDDPRNKLTAEYIKIVDIIRPKYLLFENVRGFTAAFKNSDKEPHARVVKEQLENMEWGGYHTYAAVVNASIFGVPQPRPRFILMAWRKDLNRDISFEFSPFDGIAKFAESFRLRQNLNGHDISVSEAVSDLETKKHNLKPCMRNPRFNQIDYEEPEDLTAFQCLMRNGMTNDEAPNSLRLANHRPATTRRFQAILKSCPKGKSLSSDDRSRLKMRKQCFTPLHPELPSKTITTLPDDLLHYDEPRILTVRENARIQSFPDWFDFKGNYTTGGSRRKDECPRYTQVGNAVPPLMAQALGELLNQKFVKAYR